MTPTYTHIQRVNFSTLDAAGIVHFSQYFLWMEEVEHAFLESLGLAIIDYAPDKCLGWPRLKTSAVFHAPLALGDSIEIDLFIHEIKERAVAYGFHFFRIEGLAREKVATTEMTTCYAEKSWKEDKFQRLPLPSHVLERLIHWNQGKS